MAITSGKGGVGKSIIALGLAHVLAQKGMRVLLVDADIGLGNLHILTNTVPIFTLEDLLVGRCSLEECTLTVSPNLDLIAAASGIKCEGIIYEALPIRRKFAGSKPKYDLIIIDTPSGLTVRTTCFIELADDVVLIVTPELGSLADGYAILKLLSGHSQTQQWMLFVNLAQSRNEGELTGDKFREMAEQFLGLKLRQCAWLPYDPQMKSILMRQNFLEQKAGECLFLQFVKSAVERIFADLPQPPFSFRNSPAGNTKSEFMLSSSVRFSDTGNEFPRAEALENTTATPNSQASRKDIV
jgi:flagellar biosynthesis protein FlhG